MFTVEMEDKETIVTTLDETGKFEDVTLFFDDSSVVYIRQFNEKRNKYEMIEMSYQQLLDLKAALDSPVGAFYIITHDLKEKGVK